MKPDPKARKVEKTKPKLEEDGNRGDEICGRGCATPQQKTTRETQDMDVEFRGKTPENRTVSSGSSCMGVSMSRVEKGEIRGNRIQH